MKKRTLYIPLLTTIIVSLMLTACHQAEDEIFTTADIVLNDGDTLQIERVQATALFTDLNSRRTTSMTEFEGNSLRAQLLRSAYSISVEGLLRYRDKQGTLHTRQMRAFTDYADFSAKGYNMTTLDIIFMEQ